MIYLLLWSWSAIFFSISLIFVLYSVFLTRLITFGILFSTVVRAAVAPRLVILAISPLTSFILALRQALAATLVISGILYSIFLILALYTSFLTTSFFTTSLSLQKQVNLLYFLNCLNHLVHFLIYQYLIYLHQTLNQLNQYF